ncbi:hypothetical protein ACB375_31315, partial [Klebsiella michiganensis]
RCVCGKKIGPDPRNFNQRVSLGRNDLLIRTFLKWFNPGKSLDSNLSLAGSSILLAKLPGLMNAVRRMTGRDVRKKEENFEDFIKIA